MTDGRVQFLAGVVLATRDPDRLAHFYRDVLGVPLQEQQLDNVREKYACQLGDVHFSIHAKTEFLDQAEGTGTVKLAFAIFDMDSFLERLAAHGFEPLYPPRPLGDNSLQTAVADYDGNEILITQLSAEWFTYLEERQKRGLDTVDRWKAGYFT